MDRLNQLRADAGGSKDSSIDSPPSEGFLTANESSSKYFSLSEVDSTFDISPSKDPDPNRTLTEGLMSELSPIPKNDLNFKFGKQIEAANILSGGVNIFDDNDNSYDGDELVIDDNVGSNDKNEYKLNENTVLPYKKTEPEPMDVTAIPSKDTEVVLQIDGKNVDAIDIGNGLYLYRKEGQEELAAVQIIEDDQPQPSFKFLKVRENAEGNLEVYEEIEIEVPKEVPVKEGKTNESKTVHPIKEVNKVINEPICNKVAEKKTPPKEASTCSTQAVIESKDPCTESKTEVNFNGKMMKFSESRKSPVIGSFTPMTYHSTPNKEGIPLTKTMVDQQLHPNRHSDNVKKTIEVHTDNCKQKLLETPTKYEKDSGEPHETHDSLHDKEEQVPKKDDVCSNQLAEPKLDIPQSKNLKLDIEENKDVDHKNTDETVKINQEIQGGPPDESKEVPKQSKDDIMNIGTQNSVPEINQKIEVKTNTEIFVKPTNSAEITRVDDELNCKTSEDAIKAPVLSPGKSSDINIILDETKTGKIIDEIKLPEDFKKQNNIEFEQVSTDKNNSECGKDINLNKEVMENNLKEGEQTEIVSFPDRTESQIVTKNKTLQYKQSLVVNPIQSEETVDVMAESVELKCSNEVENVINNIEDMSDKNKVLIEGEKNKSERNIETRTSDEVKQNELKHFINDPEGGMKPNKDEAKKEPPLIIIDIGKVADAPQNYIKKVTTNASHTVVKNIEMKDKSIVVKSRSGDVRTDVKKDIPKANQSKPAINNNAAVPFGKWTDANRQDFLNKIKEAKIPTNHSNTKQLKQPNDLNRRDVLQKIDSQRQSSITSAKSDANKLKKNDSAAFVNKSTLNPKDIKISNKPSMDVGEKSKQQAPKKQLKEETIRKSTVAQTLPTNKESVQRKEINNQDLIDKTIEGIINRALPAKSTQDDAKQNVESGTKDKPNSGTKSFLINLDDIEKKMNELHGIPFIERPAHELPQVAHNLDNKTLVKQDSKPTKSCKLPNLLPFPNKPQQKGTKENIVEDDSDDEIIEHEPITGDIDLRKNNTQLPPKEKIKTSEVFTTKIDNEQPKKEAIITEKDFDKFARRNSITYENCLTVNYDSKEPQKVIQTIVEKEVTPKKMSRNEIMLAESKAKSNKNLLARQHINQLSKIPTTVKTAVDDESYNKHYPTKVQMAYQSALTKRQTECPITILEDKPVKVVFMDSTEFSSPLTLNVQGQELSPSKKTPDIDSLVHSNSESLDSDILDAGYDSKSQEESKSKSKHQRKQVLTPVETPELELIEPSDLGIVVSPKKKRRIEDKIEKNTKTVVPKKSYLLNRTATTVDEKIKTQDIPNPALIEPANRNETYAPHTDAISAIDNLVKAAELLETQSETKILTDKSETSDSQQSTPIKRGRGRPRKYPLVEGVVSVADKQKTQSPPKRPRLIDAKSKKIDTDSEDSSDDDAIVKENWTMGKINENIVCPICNKLFRSENVVFKHVKHCTGPSPNRSDSDKRSPRRLRHSQESESTSDTKSDETDNYEEEKRSYKKRKSHEKSVRANSEKDDVIVIQDTPLKVCPEKHEEPKHHVSRKTLSKTNIPLRSNNLVCEFCGKTFRQLSYLVNHKLQHKKEDTKKLDQDSHATKKSVFSCDVCKKEFRKLHHLVQHRIIHYTNTVPSRLPRKSSSEQNDAKSVKEQNELKLSEEQSAGFRCEPCDKSFRKLHHLVEHRETHDGINKKCSTSSSQTVDTSKPIPAYQCDVCKKTFKKIQNLIEHKDQHLETSSEKSDDKSVKSCLSTKDIIHECSLCYMVFPNEHSLTKHTIICQRKKKQSAVKQNKQDIEEKISEDDIENATLTLIINKSDDVSKTISDIKDEGQTSTESTQIPTEIPISTRKSEEKDKKIEATPKVIENVKETEPERVPLKRDIVDPDVSRNIPDTDHETPAKVKKMEVKEVIEILDTPTPKKKMTSKEKVAPTVTKRHKSLNVTLPVIEESKTVESSDDDEVRYMLNPDYKPNETSEGKLFMKVLAKKRNSLQIERPNSKDLVKRRISLQHPPKIPRLKVKAVEPKPIDNSVKNSKQPKSEPMLETDSDDSDVKYSFPETKEDAQNDIVKKAKRQAPVDKRKSLSGIAKRKSLGQAIGTKHKINPTPVKIIKKRTTEVEHRCDCGQLFSSAALLSRHTTLAHTPPRIRRRRSPPPEVDTKTVVKRKSTTDKPKPGVEAKKPNKTVADSNKNPKAGVATRKSSVNSEAKSPNEARKAAAASALNAKQRRAAPFRGIPVPEKMRKLMEKTQKAKK